MHVVNELMPSEPAQIEEILKPGPDGPVFMVNLLKFKEKAEYEDGRKTDLTGRQAYQFYADRILELLPRYGGRAIFAGEATFLAIGQVEELWDEVIVVMYPSRGDLVAMSTSDEWRAASVHRTAGLKGQLNIETIMPGGLETSALAGSG